LRFSRRWLWRMVSSGLLRRVSLVRTDVSEEPGASFIRVKYQLVFLRSVHRLLVAAYVVPRSPILSPWWRRRQVPPKRRFLQEPHGVTTQKTPFLCISYLDVLFSRTHYSISVVPEQIIFYIDARIYRFPLSTVIFHRNRRKIWIEIFPYFQLHLLGMVFNLRNGIALLPEARVC
jgi:hypothetical protein